ncbi:MAG: oligosaccharide flippase family protein [Labedaea sp.]
MEEQQGSVATIGRKAGRGFRWALFGTLATKIGSFVMSLVLARLLVPEDFGLYAIALAATQFVIHVNDVGIMAATVQWRGKLEDMAATASTLAILFSVGWYAVFWVAAPGLAGLAGSPEATTPVRLLTAVILVDGITAVRVAALQRRFQQDQLTKALMFGFLVNASVAISLAADGAGPYSFVFGQLAGTVVTSVLEMIFAGLPLRFALDREVARRLVRFGIPLAAGLGVESVLLNADYVIVGHVLGTAAIGMYLLAFNVSSWVPGLVGTAVRHVSLAGFSRLAEDDPDALSRGVQRTVPLLFAGVLPIAVLMAALPKQLVVVLYGTEWAPAAVVLRFLAVLVIARMLTSIAFDILTSLGATRATLWLNLVWAGFLVPALYVGTRLDGIRGAAIAHGAVAVLVAIPMAVWMLHRADVHLAPVLPALARPLAGGLFAGTLMVGGAWLVGGSPIVQLTLAGGAGLVGYLLIAVPSRQILQLRALFGAAS